MSDAHGDKNMGTSMGTLGHPWGYGDMGTLMGTRVASMGEEPGDILGDMGDTHGDRDMGTPVGT